jgi:hypothetical protein
MRGTYLPPLHPLPQPLSSPVHPRSPSSSFSFHVEGQDVLDIDACAAPETARPTLPTNGPQQVEKVSTNNQHYPIEKGLYVKHPKRALTEEEALILTRVKDHGLCRNQFPAIRNLIGVSFIDVALFGSINKLIDSLFDLGNLPSCGILHMFILNEKQRAFGRNERKTIENSDRK